MKKNAFTTVPERFLKPYEIPRAKLDSAITKALDKLERNLPKLGSGFYGSCNAEYRYQEVANKSWVSGMNTGVYWLAYELSGNPKFKEVAERMLPSYQYRWEEKIGFDDHDVGFVYTPSCVAAYRNFGHTELKKLLLDAVDYYYHTGYTKEGGFILRIWKSKDNESGCRTMMDTLMNAPFLFWAGKETGKQEYIDAALSQNRLTAELLIREDGSSFHHYQFEPGTYKPVRGLTLQGHSDDSCWSRGHAWGIYGFPIAYSYVKEDYLVDIHKDITYFMLNHLPEDLIPYWDFDFTSGDQPRDSSAGVISVCGLHEMAKLLPDHSPEKQIYQSAAAQILDATIDICAGDPGYDYDGLICHTTAGYPQNVGIDSCVVYGDYFYLESLMRFTNPDWVKYW